MFAYPSRLAQETNNDESEFGLRGKDDETMRLLHQDSSQVFPSSSPRTAGDGSSLELAGARGEFMGNSYGTRRKVVGKSP